MKLIALLLLISNMAMARPFCSKQLAEEKVNFICQGLTKNGKAFINNWKNDLVFENCGKNYLWIQDTSPEIKMIVHPIKQRLMNTYVGNNTDENHFHLFQAFDKMAKNNPKGGWVDYVWPKLGEEKSTPKTSYVKLCTLPTGEQWIVGTGIWKADL